jgi:hypothetical protein
MVMVRKMALFVGFFLLGIHISLAQAPQRMSYQAVIRNNNNDVRYTRPFDFINPDYIPFGNSPLVNTAARTAVTSSFSNETKLAGLRPVDFIGGIAPAGELSAWYKGWTMFK